MVCEEGEWVVCEEAGCDDRGTIWKGSHAYTCK